MKRGDILTGVVYGYSEDRAYIHRYQPVLILSLDSYWRPRYGDDRNVLQPTSEPRERLNRGGWRTSTAPVGLLAVTLPESYDLARVMAAASVEGALVAMNGEQQRSINDAKGHLGSYILVTNAGDLHGEYATLKAQKDEAERLSSQYAQQHEEQRLANVGLHNGLADRLDKLGLTGYHVAAYESPSRFEGLKFEDMEELLALAEDGALMRSKE